MTAHVKSESPHTVTAHVSLPALGLIDHRQLGCEPTFIDDLTVNSRAVMELPTEHK